MFVINMLRLWERHNSHISEAVAFSPDISFLTSTNTEHVRLPFKQSLRLCLRERPWDKLPHSISTTVKDESAAASGIQASHYNRHLATNTSITARLRGEPTNTSNKPLSGPMRFRPCHYFEDFTENGEGGIKRETNASRIHSLLRNQGPLFTHSNNKTLHHMVFYDFFFFFVALLKPGAAPFPPSFFFLLRTWAWHHFHRDKPLDPLLSHCIIVINGHPNTLT